MLAMYSMCFASLIRALFNRRVVITAMDQILLHENCDLIYSKTRQILLLELSLFLSLLNGFYCYHVYVLTDGTSNINFIAKDLANFSNIIMVIQYINIMQILRHRFRNLNQQLAKYYDSKSRILVE